MRIALIQPNLHTRYPQPPLGLLTIAAVCLDQGHSVQIVDANADNLSPDDVVALVELSDIVGITAMSLSYPEVVALATVIRKAYPHRFLVLGGVHATLFQQEILDTSAFDAVVVGEGEKVMQEVLSRREKTVYRAEGLVDIDDVPPLPYHLLDDHYHAMPPHGQHRPFMPVLTSRGCPFHCSFCSKAVFGSTYRTRSIDGVMKEIDILASQFGVREIIFYDDVFTLNKERTIELSQRLLGGPVGWTCQTRVNLVNRATLQAMKNGGCYAVAYGIESADPRILKGISKNINTEQVEEAVRYSKEVGLRVIGYFMLGSPGETIDTIKKTVDWSIALGIDYAQFSVLTPLPGSELYELVPESQRANSYALVGEGGPGLCGLSSTQLSEAVSVAYRHFYMRPGYVMQQLRRMAVSWAECRMVLEGFQMFLRGGP